MNAGAPVTLSAELDLSGRKYPVIASMAVLMGPLLLFWGGAIALVVNILHRHPALLGVK
jgi:hypothetical protein